MEVAVIPKLAVTLSGSLGPSITAEATAWRSFSAVARTFSADMRQNDGEFLAAKPPKQVARAQLFLASGSHRFNDIITGLMAITVIDRLKVVDIEHDAANVMAVPKRLRDEPIRFLLERPSGQ